MSGSENEKNTPTAVEGTDHSHGHHHEHREHHHKSRQKKKRRYRNKIQTFVMERWQQLAGVAVVLILLIGLIVMIFKEAEANREAQGQLPEQTGQVSLQTRPEEPKTLTLQLPWLPEEVPVIGQAAQALLSAGGEEDAQQILASYRKENDRLDVGLPVQLSFDVVSLPLGEKIDRFRVDLWKEGDPDGVQTFDLKASKRSLDLTCLETGAEYQYEITAFLTGGTSHKIGGSFRTEASPRILSVAGIRNVRDLGGWKTTDSKTLRQGLLFRGSELDGAVKEYYKISDTGREDMLSRLGVRSELDLRPEGTGFNALGASVRHTYFGMSAYGDIFSEEGKEPVRQLFETLADPEAYPVYLHGTYGTARTGTACYLLQALLGVGEEDLLREYELSALASESVSRQDILPMVDVLKTYGGADMQENVQLYLKSIGVTQAQIDAICQIWLA